MYLDKIKINNFRQFENEVIDFDSNLTLIAGSNNSGKTSLLDFIEKVFSQESKVNFTVQDFSISTIKKIKEELEKLFQSIKDNDEMQKEKHIEELMKNKYAISMCITIGYKKEDNISNFAEYLMELDDDKQYFYFYFEHSGDIRKFAEDLEENKEFFGSKDLLEHYIKTFKSSYYYCDSKFELKYDIKKHEFQRLCNFKFIRANKKLSDEKLDKKYSIANSIITLLEYNESWKDTLEEVETRIKNLFQNSSDNNDLEKTINEQINESSLNALRELLEELQKTNGNVKEVLRLNLNIDREVIKKLLEMVMAAQYEIDELYFDENIQGLGYSNLIFLHLNIEEFKRKQEADKLTLLIVEEPEVHMHPQMQRAYMEQLNTHFITAMQGMFTTHSTEIGKISNMEHIRVIRKEERVNKSKIYDLNTFSSKDGNDKSRFSELLFNINLSELIFADRAILYEGDTERMYLQALIDLPLRITDGQEMDVGKFSKLKSMYIAYIQVGGAYAQKYKEILEYLKIKSVIFTDIDYKKCNLKVEDIKNSETTNSTIREFSNLKSVDKNYRWKDKGNNIFKKKVKIKKDEKKNITEEKELFSVQFQDEKDGYARTLEEAMILKLFTDEKIDFEQEEKDWATKFKELSLSVSLPAKSGEIKINDDNKLNLRDIIDRTGFKKTNFMYSVIENNHQLKMLPNYIEEGLEWLME